MKFDELRHSKQAQLSPTLAHYTREGASSPVWSLGCELPGLTVRATRLGPTPQAHRRSGRAKLRGNHAADADAVPRVCAGAKARARAKSKRSTSAGPRCTHLENSLSRCKRSIHTPQSVADVPLLCESSLLLRQPRRLRKSLLCSTNAPASAGWRTPPAMFPFPSQQPSSGRVVDLAALRAKRKAEKEALAAAEAAEAGTGDAEEDEEFYRAPAPSPPSKRQRYVADEPAAPEEAEDEEDHIIPAEGPEADEKYVERPLAVPGNIWHSMANFQRQGSTFVLQNFYAGPPLHFPGTACSSLPLPVQVASF